MIASPAGDKKLHEYADWEGGNPPDTDHFLIRSTIRGW